MKHLFQNSSKDSPKRSCEAPSAGPCETSYKVPCETSYKVPCETSYEVSCVTIGLVVNLPYTIPT